MDYGADPFRKDKSNRTARITVVSQIFSRTSLIERLYKFGTWQVKTISYVIYEFDNNKKNDFVPHGTIKKFKFSEFLYACARGLVEEIEKLIKEDPAKSKTLLESGLNAASCNGEIKVNFI